MALFWRHGFDIKEDDGQKKQKISSNFELYFVSGTMLAQYTLELSKVDIVLLFLLKIKKLRSRKVNPSSLPI